MREWDQQGRDATLSFAQAAALADSLAKVMDEVETQGCDLDRLKDLLPPEMAEHWQGVTRFLDVLHVAWPEVLAHLEEHSRLVWMLVSQNASVAGFDGQLLTIGFSGDGPRDTVQRRGGDQVIAQAVHAVLGIQPRLDLITGGSAPAGGSGPKAEGRPAPAAPRPDAVEEPAAAARATPDGAATAAPPA